jgi:CBS domain-containing protein
VSTLVRGILARKGTHVHSIGPDEDVYAALERMAEHDIGALVVVDGGDVVGVMSERDYARKVSLFGRASRDTRVRDVMSPPEHTASLDDTVAACMARVTVSRMRHLPVLDGGRLVGLVSIGDLVKAIIDEQSFVIEQLHEYISGAH